MKENQIEREIIRFLRQIGFSVYKLSQGYRKERGGTRQTPGLPDLYVMGFGSAFWVEVKGPKGRLREAQEGFRLAAEDNDVGWHLWRDVTDAWEWAVEAGHIVEAA